MSQIKAILYIRNEQYSKENLFELDYYMKSSTVPCRLVSVSYDGTHMHFRHTFKLILRHGKEEKKNISSIKTIL